MRPGGGRIAARLRDGYDVGFLPSRVVISEADRSADDRDEFVGVCVVGPLERAIPKATGTRHGSVGDVLERRFDFFDGDGGAFSGVVVGTDIVGGRRGRRGVTAGGKGTWRCGVVVLEFPRRAGSGRLTLTVAIWWVGETHRRSRSSACALALAPAALCRDGRGGGRTDAGCIQFVIEACIFNTQEYF